MAQAASAACDGCPAFNNRVSKTAALALESSASARTSPTAKQDVPVPAPEEEHDSVLVACPELSYYYDAVVET